MCAILDVQAIEVVVEDGEREECGAGRLGEPRQCVVGDHVCSAPAERPTGSPYSVSVCAVSVLNAERASHAQNLPRSSAALGEKDGQRHGSPSMVAIRCKQRAECELQTGTHHWHNCPHSM